MELNLKSEIIQNGVVTTNKVNMQKTHSVNTTEVVAQVKSALAAEFENAEPGYQYDISVSVTRSKMPKPAAR